MYNIREKLTPAVFLDRDGVLNRAIVQNGKPYAPRCLKDFEITPEAIQATQMLKKAGFLLIVVTNQPDVGNQLISQSIVEEMHKLLFKLLSLDDIRVCYHSQLVKCSCRKPNPGMLLEATDLWGIDLKRSFMVGDRASDIIAGNAVGCRTVFIDYHYAETQHLIIPDVLVNSFEEAAQSIIRCRVLI